MEAFIKYFRIVVSAIGGFVVIHLGGMDELLTTVLVFMAIDILTGLICSLVTKTTSSSVMFKGILKKFFELVIIMATVQLDILIKADLGLAIHLREFFIVYVLLDEILSVVENACLLGIFPESFREKFIQVKEDFVVSLGSALLSIAEAVKDAVIAALTGKAPKAPEVDSKDEKNQDPTNPTSE